jgi:hypothetical protein
VNPVKPDLKLLIVCARAEDFQRKVHQVHPRANERRASEDMACDLASPMQATQPPPGVRCPACGRCELTLGADARGRAALSCAGCRTFVRLLWRHGDPEPGFEPCPPGASKYAQDAPPAGSWWLGMIRQADAVWRAVALTPTHAGCWDALLTYFGEGDRLTVPTDPPRRAEGETG